VAANEGADASGGSDAIVAADASVAPDATAPADAMSSGDAIPAGDAIVGSDATTAADTGTRDAGGSADTGSPDATGAPDASPTLLGQSGIVVSGTVSRVLAVAPTDDSIVYAVPSSLTGQTLLLFDGRRTATTAVYPGSADAAGYAANGRWLWVGGSALVALYGVETRTRTTFLGDPFQVLDGGLQLVHVSFASNDTCGEAPTGGTVSEMDFQSGSSRPLFVDPSIVNGAPSPGFVVSANGTAIAYTGFVAAMPHGIYEYDYRLWLGRPGDPIWTSMQATSAPGPFCATLPLVPAVFSISGGRVAFPTAEFDSATLQPLATLPPGYDPASYLVGDTLLLSGGGNAIARFDRPTASAVRIGDQAVERRDRYLNYVTFGHARALVAAPDGAELVLYEDLSNTLSRIGPGSPLSFSPDDSKLLVQTSTQSGALVIYDLGRHAITPVGINVYDLLPLPAQPGQTPGAPVFAGNNRWLVALDANSVLHGIDVSSGAMHAIADHVTSFASGSSVLAYTVNSTVVGASGLWITTLP
jgi:hypothetical protein